MFVITILYWWTKNNSIVPLCGNFNFFFPRMKSAVCFLIICFHRKRDSEISSSDRVFAATTRDIIFPLNWVKNEKFYQIGARRSKEFITIGFLRRGLYISSGFNKGKDAIYTGYHQIQWRRLIYRRKKVVKELALLTPWQVLSLRRSICYYIRNATELLICR